MDIPLLALTRRAVTQPGEPSPEIVANENMRQLIQLRWIAVVGQLVTILVVYFGLDIALPLVPMLGVVALLMLVNIVSTLLLSRHRSTNTELLLALLFDVGSLTVQLYMSGGAANPFISLFLVQIVLGAILLRTSSVWVLVVFASLCFAFVALRNRPLVYPDDLLPDAADLYQLGNWLSFILVGILLVLFINRISRNLRARDVHVADMRQHAAEEDHIVRMGLFASGAAHELGTPLASLSVILSDWRRMPKLANDPELLGEIEEMEEEVQRCKAIVTDILHSAGQPRGEELASTEADPYLDNVIGEWRNTHPSTRLVERRTGTERAVIIADPALRQAIWNLLDNAAETSTNEISFEAIREGDRLVLAVRDRGKGFDPAVLKNFGKPYHSRKGPGHGVGLFLVSNVMRRLQGGVEAANLPGGGAEVKLFLPLVATRSGKA